MSRVNTMDNTISFYSTRGTYGFLSNFYPSPFVADSERWRTSEHYFQAMKTLDPERRMAIQGASSPTQAASMGRDVIATTLRSDWNEPVDTDEAREIATAIGVPTITTKDMVMLNAIRYKFFGNPTLAISLKNTAPRMLIESAPNDSYWGNARGGTNMLGKLLMYLRDYVIPDTYGQEKDNTEIIFTNLFTMLSEQGYDVPSDIPTEDVQGLELTGSAGNAILDIFIDKQYPESRLKAVIEKNEPLRDKPTYIIVGYIAKANMTKILNRIASYNNIRYYSPSELLATASRHKKNPTFSVVSPNDPGYEELRSMQMAELDINDKLVRQLGLKNGDILQVNDFSPHYRIVV